MAARAPLPVLHRLDSQHSVHAYSLVRSPMMMQPGSHLEVQFRSRENRRGADVVFSVDVVYENRFVCNRE